MCELFHCRPSELDNEDGLLLLQLMELKHWRDVASYYDEDPGTKMVSNDEKFRFVALSFGVMDALTADLDTLGERIKEARLHPQDDWWKLSSSKMREIKASANALNDVRSEPPKTMGKK